MYIANFRQYWFQWGHNLTVMDTTFIFLHQRAIYSTGFQWGHNLTVMDTRQLIIMEMHRRFVFQWGHNLTVMDTAPKCKIS